MPESVKNQLHQIRIHLMTGVSYMIPVVVIGGLLASIAVIIGGPGVWDAKDTFASNLKDIGVFGITINCTCNCCIHSIFYC